MLTVIFSLIAFFIGITAAMCTPIPLTETQISEANVRCSSNENLDHIDVRAGRATAYCTNGAVFILKEK